MKKRKGIIIGVICFLIIGEIGFYMYMKYRKVYDQLFIEFNDIEVIEYGKDIDVKSFIKDSYGEVVYPSLDTGKMGVHRLTFTVKDKNISKDYKMEVEVKDCTQPVIELKKNKVETEYGKSIKIDDYIKSVYDNVDGELQKSNKDTVGYYDDDKIDYQKSGTYKVEVLAMDSQGNKSKEILSVVVKEREFKHNEGQKIIVINPGHQKDANSDKEAIGPNSDEYKAKVSYGTVGSYSGVDESKTALNVGKKLKKELEKRGYLVYMTRTSQDVDISNKERAEFANGKKADLMISLHCDATDDHSVTGAHTISISKNNEYCSYLYNYSNLLAKCVVDEYCKKTDIDNRGVSYRNNLTTLNWSEMPSIMLEMGFISNMQQDTLLNHSDFQNMMAKGIANGIDRYFSNVVE